MSGLVRVVICTGKIPVAGKMLKTPTTALNAVSDTRAWQEAIADGAHHT